MSKRKGSGKKNEVASVDTAVPATMAGSSGVGGRGGSIAPGMSSMGGGAGAPSFPGPHLKDTELENRILTMLQENVMLITKVRENMLTGRMMD